MASVEEVYAPVRKLDVGTSTYKQPRLAIKHFGAFWVALSFVLVLSTIFFAWTAYRASTSAKCNDIIFNPSTKQMTCEVFLNE